MQRTQTPDYLKDPADHDKTLSFGISRAEYDILTGLSRDLRTNRSNLARIPFRDGLKRLPQEVL